MNLKCMFAFEMESPSEKWLNRTPLDGVGAHRAWALQSGALAAALQGLLGRLELLGKPVG